MQNFEFYRSHLERVSRSFLYGITCLSAELRQKVGLIYLLCRVLDSIEDAQWDSKSDQSLAFERFREILLHTGPLSDLKENVAIFVASMPQLPEGEVLLMGDLFTLLQDFHSLDPELKEPLKQGILSMSRGMEFFLGKRITCESELNQYSLFVAGIVGDILHTMLTYVAEETYFSDKVHLQIHHFGLFLQKINILKDQEEDEAQGRFFVYSREEIAGSLREHAIHAFDYINDIPNEQAEYKMFCASALFLGLEAIIWIMRGEKKAPREKSEQILMELQRILPSSYYLQVFFIEKLKHLPEAKLPLSDVQSRLTDVRSMYSFQFLTDEHIESLKLK